MRHCGMQTVVTCYFVHSPNERHDNMIVDLARGSLPPSIDVDVCVAGGGAAGLALTVELAAKGLRVALLESGGKVFESRSQQLCAGDSQSLPYAGLYNGRGRILGGTTTLWGGQVLEMDAHIFGERPWIAGGAWPYPKHELDDYYAQASRFEGLLPGPGDPALIWQALGSPDLSFPADLYTAFSRWCPQRNLVRLHLDTLASNPEVTVYLHANVCSVRFAGDDETLAAFGVRALGRPPVEFRASRFVLAVGAIETSRLLLQPSFSNGPAPWMAAGLVGRNFQDHVCSNYATVELTHAAAARLFDYVAVAGLKYHAKIKLLPQTQQRLRTLDVCGTIAATTEGIDDVAMAFETYRLWKTRQVRNLTAARVAQFIRTIPQLLWHRAPFARSRRRPSARRKTLRLFVHCEQNPISSNSITLGDDRDGLGLLRARVRWAATAMEMHTIRTFARLARERFHALGLGEVQPDDRVETDDGALTSTFCETHHHIGGTRMALGAAAGVVDENLRVFGTNNFYICSNSVFPSAGFANPTHTLIALAMKLASHLAVVSGRASS